MKTLKLAGTKTIKEIRDNKIYNFCLWLVNTKGGDLPTIIKFEQNQGSTANIHLELDGEILPFLASDYNHIGGIIQANYFQKIEYLKKFLRTIPKITVIDSAVTNTMILEETQLPGKAIKAVDQLTDIDEYIDGLARGRYNNFILGVPKFKVINSEVIKDARNIVGSVPYGYFNLLSFIYYFTYKKWIGSKSDKRGTCSEFWAAFILDSIRNWILALHPIDMMWYRVRDRVRQFFKIAPVNLALMDDIFDYYLVIQ